MAETGFHSAITFKGPGRLFDGTKVLAMNVNGKITMKLALLNTSGLRIHRPITAIIHDSAYAKSSSKAKPANASGKDVCTRQPTSRPVTDMTTRLITLFTTSLVVRPINTADRAIGSERNRSMMPFWMSSASPSPVHVAPKTAVCTKIPAIRNSR
ncbi:hypothetical protein KIPE111705_40190 [Kibdelosporangium persicum]